MTSAYETWMEREQQKATTPRCSARACFDDRELNNPEIIANMEETLSSSSSSRASFATSDSSFEELAVSSVEISQVQSGESSDRDMSALEEEARRMMEDDAREKKKTDGENIDASANSINDTWRTNELRNEERSLEGSEKRKKKDSISIPSSTDSIMPECEFTCTKKEQVKNQIKDQTKGKDQRNQSVLEIHVQEGRACDSIHAGEDLRNSAATDESLMRVCCENVAKLCLDTIGRQDEFEREIIDWQDGGSFYDAVRSQNTERVSMLIASGHVPNLDEPDWNVSGDPPLLMAATNHCLPVLSTLLASGCNPAVRSPRGETALHRAILNGGPGNVLKFVEELLRHGCPPGVKEAGNGSTALHMLSRQLAHAPLKYLHPNHDAALKTLELLAKAGPVNAKDHQGRNALHILASSTIFDNNHKTDIESLIGTLLTAGADAALRNDRGETALHESLECGALNTATLLISHTPAGITSRYGETPLHVASRKNQVDIVAKLLEHGEDPGVQDAGDNTPLHLASARGFHQTVSLLVTSPLAQLEKANIDGLTALQVAAESGFVNAVRILLKAGADPSQTMHYCATILRRHPDISLLIDHELTRRRQFAA